MLPSGSWAAYDPTYYATFYKKWQKEYDAHVRALEKGTKGFEAYDEGDAAEVDAAAEMEKAREEVQVQEERKALTGANQHAGATPKMNIKGAALSGRARGRHQLTTLLTEAYANREELEERIAQGRRNRKEAGNKYGACSHSLIDARAEYSGQVSERDPLRVVHAVSLTCSQARRLCAPCHMSRLSIMFLFVPPGVFALQRA